MSITIKLYIPNKVFAKVRVLQNQTIPILNQIAVFSSNNKMLFISKGIILSYKKSFYDCKINDGDIIYALNINDNVKIIENILNINDDIKTELINKYLSIRGPFNEANLSSINRVIEKSQNIDFENSKIVIKDKSSFAFNAKLKDIRTFRKFNNRRLWNRHMRHFLENKENNNNNLNSLDFSNINYIPPINPCCDAFPISFKI